MQNDGIILFDGVCNLCNGVVVFIIKRDPASTFRFASLQSPAGQQLLKRFGLPMNQLNSFVYVKNNRAYLKSAAVLQVMKDLGGIWRMSAAFRILPRRFRDFVYDIVAKSRYHIFGRRNACMIPTPELRKRFLD
jgi:predicted DCC family thiol-disulfide oxidoreductase YuxK